MRQRYRENGKLEKKKVGYMTEVTLFVGMCLGKKKRESEKDVCLVSHSIGVFEMLTEN